MGNDFQISWDDGERVFARAPGAGPDASVLLARLAAEQPPPASLERLTHEFGLKDELDGAWAARPLALTREGGRSVLVLEDAGGQPLAHLLGLPLPIDACLRLAVSIADALCQLHRRGLVHKDLKPTHIVVDCADGHARLTGFGLTSRLPRERQAPEPPETIAGTLAYMAPEQTGRMNRSIDSRSDLYAFGITLYQMLTGTLPFAAVEPMEWVHCHIARAPVPPAVRVAGVPAMLSGIVMKLLAKTPEDRYQTAAGVAHDLRRCHDEWRRRGRIDEFPLDEHGTPDRLRIPEKLYGREHEVGQLVDAFSRIVASSTPELVLVSGYSGIGKSSVVNELHKALVPPRGLFASGKFDQYQRNIPYATLVQAFQSLVRTLLCKCDAELASWRAALQQALEPNARLMTDLIPELRLIIGDPPPVPALEPQQAQRRFLLVFRRFIGVFARPEHPLALFLDDLQWLDAATLDLLEDLLTSADLRHLMLIGAYRDNEVDATHPLTAKLESIRAAGGRIEAITLAPLGAVHVRQLIAEALHSEPACIEPLAALVCDKTGGNPFFVIQFLHALVEEDLLSFRHDARAWRWDADRIHAKGYTDNIVHLMIGKLARLPMATRHALQQMACLGNVVETARLSLVLGLPPAQVHAVLWEAIRLELVERREAVYAFAHDRVHEAAYSLIPEAARAAAHLRLGRLLAAHTPPETREESIFEIVGQLNRGAALIADGNEREQLAALNLSAGRRAKASTAYASALAYLVTGAGLLDDGATHPHDLTFALALNRAECEFLTGQLAAADERLMALSAQATTTAERALVAFLHLDVYLVLDHSDRAVAVCLAFLRHVGIDWSPHPDDEAVRREYEQIWTRLGERGIESVLDLPPMDDATSLATVEALSKLFAPALQSDANLADLTICKGVSISLERGNCDASCVAYANLGRISGPRFGAYDAGYRFGMVGCQLVDQRGLTRFEAKTYLCFSIFVMRWMRPVRECRALLERAFDAANRSGDLSYGAYTRNNLVSDLLFGGTPLPEVQREAERGLAYAQKVGFGLVVEFIATQRAMVRMLRGHTPTFGSFDDAQFDERRTEAQFDSNPGLALGAYWYWTRKLQACYFAGNLAAALAAAARAEALQWAATSFFEEAEFQFFSALVRAARCDQGRHRDALLAHHARLQHWAELCPANFADRAYLVGAEIARIDERLVDAEHGYERAIHAAQESGFVHNEAIANELASRFYAARGLERIARAYMQDARYAYLRWGADGMVRQLEERYPYLRAESHAPGPTTTITTPVEHLDLATVLKVSQAASADLVLEKLIDMVMRTAIEQAGAERGLLILSVGGEPRIAAEATTGGDAMQVVLQDGAPGQQRLPESVLYQVWRTHESVFADDATSEPAFATDAYLHQHRTRSLLCLPLLNRAKLIGALYLENNLMARAFSPSRVAVLKLVASQAAISLENARLYRDLEEREAEVRETERRYREVQTELAHANRVATMGQLAASIAHEVNQPIAATVTNAQAALRWLRTAPANLDEVGLALGRIVRDADRAADVIARIRELVRKAPPRRAPVDINAAIREVVALTRGEATKSETSVRLALAEGLPRIHGDRVELQQVLINLIFNALEAMRDSGKGGRRVEIRTASPDPATVLVSVSDSGPGFAPENIERVFLPFYTTKDTGLGMGLSICRSIIDGHGGRLWASENVPRGAVVQFTVPAAGC